MEKLIAESGGLRLFSREAKRWVIYRFEFEAENKPSKDELTEVLGGLSRSAAEEAGPICVVLGDLPQPNSRMLASLISLLMTKDGSQRRVALAGPAQGWLDMLEILGLRARFLVVEDPGDLTLEE